MKKHNIHLEHNIHVGIYRVSSSERTPKGHCAQPDVSHFRVFGSEAWAHIPDEKHKALEPKSEKCTFVRYSEDVKGYRLIPFKSKNVIIRRDVKFAENISACEPSPADVPPLPISSTFENISSSDDESEDDNPPPPSQDPPSAP